MRVLAGQLAPAAGEVVAPASSRLVVACLDQHSGRRLLQQHGSSISTDGGPATPFSAVQVGAAPERCGLPLPCPQAPYLCTARTCILSRVHPFDG